MHAVGLSLAWSYIIRLCLYSRQCVYGASVFVALAILATFGEVFYNLMTSRNTTVYRYHGISVCDGTEIPWNIVSIAWYRTSLIVINMRHGPYLLRSSMAACCCMPGIWLTNAVTRGGVFCVLNTPETIFFTENPEKQHVLQFQDFLFNKNSGRTVTFCGSVGKIPGYLDTRT